MPVNNIFQCSETFREIYTNNCDLSCQVLMKVPSNTVECAQKQQLIVSSTNESGTLAPGNALCLVCLYSNILIVDQLKLILNVDQ